MMPVVKIFVHCPVATSPLSAFAILLVLSLLFLRALLPLALLSLQGRFVPSFSRAKDLGGGYCGRHGHCNRLRHHFPVSLNLARNRIPFRVDLTWWSHFGLFVRSMNLLVRDNIRNAVPVHGWLPLVSGELFLA